MLRQAHIYDGSVVEVVEVGSDKFLEVDSSAKNKQIQFYNRCAVLPPLLEGKKFKMPQKPKDDKKPKLPLMNVLLPMMMGAMFYFMMPNPMTAMFMLMSPLLMISSTVSSRREFKREAKRKEKEYAKKCKEVRYKAECLRDREEDVLRCRNPDFDQVHLWQKHSSDPDFLQVRVGVADIDSSVMLDDTPLTLQNVPLLVDLTRGVGLIVDSPLALRRLQGFLLELVTLYSPNDLTIGVLSLGSNPELAWLKWVQNVDTKLCSRSQKSFLGVLQTLVELISERSKLSDAELRQEKVLLIIVENIIDTHWHIIEKLMADGAKLKLHFIFLAGDASTIPFNVRQVVNLQSNVLFDRQKNIKHQYSRCAEADKTSCLNYSRKVCAKRDLSLVPENDQNIPKYISLGDLLHLDAELLGAEICTRWANTDTGTGVKLSAEVGMSANDVVEIDLRKNGPHTLVGGTTGAGKSEFLQTWIASLALNCSPENLNFLLVDYKGGAAFGKCSTLTHTVGMITDLDEHLTSRVLVSLKAELEFREGVLGKYHAKDIVELEEKEGAILANLLIVVDEFAALAKEMPEFVDQIVDIAARGRSLGVHLIMATQRPSGVIKDNLKANTNLRIALRVADENESNDIIGSKDAAGIKRGTPGRLFIKHDTETPVEMQAAYVGYEVGEVKSDVEVYEFELGELTKIQLNQRENSVVKPGTELRDAKSTFLSILVEECNRAASKNNISALRRPWLEPLKDVYLFETSRPHFAILDLPAKQEQVELNICRKNTIVFGKTGAGKTVALESMLLEWALLDNVGTIRGTDVFIIDCSRTKYLPCIQDAFQIVDINDYERIWRLFRAILEDGVKCTLVIDRIDIFRDEFEKPAGTQILSMFNQILANSAGLGVVLAATVARSGGVYNNWLSFFEQRIVLEMSNENEYAFLGINQKNVPLSFVPGRGIFNAQELQISLPEDVPLKHKNRRQIKSLEEASRVADPHQSVIRIDDLSELDIASTLHISDFSALAVCVLGGKRADRKRAANVLKGVLQAGSMREVAVRDIGSSNLEDLGESGVFVIDDSASGDWNAQTKIKKCDLIVCLSLDPAQVGKWTSEDIPQLKYIEKGDSRGYIISSECAVGVQF
jgi:S-DNA-T family DNA segregation ATPase FtsK/SpoIIIE